MGENLAPADLLASQVLLVFLALTFSAIFLSVKLSSPRLAILGRWLRWATVGLGFAYLVRAFELYPVGYEVLVPIGLLGWFLLETAYNWVAIGALSRSGVPLFPSFIANEDGDEWPAHPRLIEIRDWIRRQGYQKKLAAKARIDDIAILRISVYQDEEDLVRLQVLFIPQRGGGFTACYVLASQTESGHRLITDNFFLPFGGFYPDEWHLQRLPLVRTLKGLLARHRKRLESASEKLVPWVTDPLEDMNEQQRILEQINTDLGFLLPREVQEEEGKLTPAGHYRVWKELWLLNYFGLARAY